MKADLQALGASQGLSHEFIMRQGNHDIVEEIEVTDR